MAAKKCKIEHCYFCGYHQFVTENKNRHKCQNSDAAYKNGRYRIINRDIYYEGKIPDWCPLEDYYFQPTYLKEDKHI